MSRVGGGARTKPRPPQDVCADCGALEPGWASINRGILICDECCSVHRSLGRHISQVKSLKKGTWHPTQHAMVHALYSSGANGIWEHTLLDPSVAKTGRRKPQPKDPVHPTKADFIRAKHQMLSFVYRPQREEVSGTDGDVSRQLHSSVRTSNLETSLRLLSQGADPNYFYKDKNCYPLHVAARAGQSTQAELLIVYGADPGALDAQGNTPSNYASEANHPELAEHLLECQYELTDRLAFYLSGRKPDHTQGQHWIIPEMADSLDMSDLAKEARVKLQQLPNHLFEELACDVYDEVDRRETDAIWLSLQNQSALVSDRCTVPFLPVNPEYSSTRNQGRQKLARFNAREFATLIIDILNDAKRRQLGITSPSATVKDKDSGDVTLTLLNSPKPPHLHNNAVSLSARTVSNPQPPPLPPPLPASSSATNSSSCCSSPLLKDSQHRQAFTSLPPSSSETLSSHTDHLHHHRLPHHHHHHPHHHHHHHTSSFPALTDTPSGPKSLPSYTSSSSPATSAAHTTNNNNKGEMTDDGEPLYDSVASEDDYSYVETEQKLAQQRQILEEQRRQHQLEELYSEPTSETMTSMDSTVSLEAYIEVKEKLESSEAHIQELQTNNAHMRSQLSELSTVVKSLRDENESLRSMYSSGGGLGGSVGPSSLTSTPPPSFHYPQHNGDIDPQVNMRGSRGAVQRPFSMFEPRQGPPSLTPAPYPMDHPRNPAFHVRMSGEYDNTSSRSTSTEPSETTPLRDSHGHPSQEEVVKKTEVITKRIQELLISAQEGRQEAFLPCADQIHSAVLDMDSIFPKGRCSTGVQGALRQLVSSASRLQSECRSHQHPGLDPKFVTQQVIQCAYDIAKGAKLLVTHFQ